MRFWPSPIQIRHIHRYTCTHSGQDQYIIVTAVYENMNLLVINFFSDFMQIYEITQWSRGRQDKSLDSGKFKKSTLENFITTSQNAVKYHLKSWSIEGEIVPSTQLCESKGLQTTFSEYRSAFIAGVPRLCVVSWLPRNKGMNVNWRRSTMKFDTEQNMSWNAWGWVFGCAP